MPLNRPIVRSIPIHCPLCGFDNMIELEGLTLECDESFAGKCDGCGKGIELAGCFAQGEYGFTITMRQPDSWLQPEEKPEPIPEGK